MGHFVLFLFESCNYVSFLIQTISYVFSLFIDKFGKQDISREFWSTSNEDHQGFRSF